jgi:hypothetical protein
MRILTSYDLEGMPRLRALVDARLYRILDRHAYGRRPRKRKRR